MITPVFQQKCSNGRITLSLHFQVPKIQQMQIIKSHDEINSKEYDNYLVYPRCRGRF